jgi:thiol:disulfide interchange protein DsbG
MNRRKVLQIQLLIGMLANPVLSRLASAQSQPQQQTHQCINLPDLFDQFFIDGTGFEVPSTLKEKRTAYVVFDPQCPDCIHFWRMASAVRERIRFIWFPVAVLNSRSELQGALILSSPSPIEAMARQVMQFDTPSRGLPTDNITIPNGARDLIWRNSRIFRRAGGKNVPYILYQDEQNTVRGSADIATSDALTAFLNI